MKRAILSHRVRAATDAGRQPPLLTEEWLDEFIASSPKLPNVAEQATNIIRLIGDHACVDGDPMPELPISWGAKVGSISRDFAARLTRQLFTDGFITGDQAGTHASRYELINLDLTLRGWERFEAERRGQTAGAYGFIALKFDDQVLDPFLREVIKPAVRKMGYDLADMRDTAEAGVIDNLLRVRIRDAAFVLVDLTHENPGAYWEAGYAEGLGKPVLYLCERAKFEAAKTHFDTNHSTTVCWAPDEAAKFEADLVATLRRSLNLFADH
jgi:nucleoside 2-deoxyribosyltransferase